MDTPDTPFLYHHVEGILINQEEFDILKSCGKFTARQDNVDLGMEFIYLGDTEIWNWYFGDRSATQKAIQPLNGLKVEFWSIEAWDKGPCNREIGIIPLTEKWWLKLTIRQVLMDLEKLIPDGDSKKLRLRGNSCGGDAEGINAVLVYSKPGNLPKIQRLISDTRKPIQSLLYLGIACILVIVFIEIRRTYVLGLQLGTTGFSDWSLLTLAVAMMNLGGWQMINLLRTALKNILVCGN